MITVADAEDEQAEAPLATQAASANQLDEELIYTNQPPPPPKPKEILQPLDVTPFLKWVDQLHSGS